MQLQQQTEYGFGNQFGAAQTQYIQQQQNDHRIMGQVDPNMLNRPEPPQVYPHYDQQTETALRVRRWIESKSVTDVKDCRPLLNQEIQKGFSLRKTQDSNDRSAPIL